MKMYTSRLAAMAIGFILALGVVIPAQAAFPAKYHPGHYMLAYFELSYPNKEFDRIKYEPNFIGVQRRYPWKRIEPARGVYDFSAIVADLQYLQSMPTLKSLIIEITDNGRDSYQSSRGNLVTRRWNTAVQDRQIALFNALGARFDNEPFVEGVVLDETATGIQPAEWGKASYTAYKGFEGEKRIMSGLKTAFPNTVCIQYMNYFSTIWQEGNSQMAGLAQHAFQAGLGMGGPDVHVGGGETSYPFYPVYAGVCRSALRCSMKIIPTAIPRPSWS